MTFLHVSLLLGSIASFAPILFHLLGKRQPKTLEFPAIRFVRKTAVEAQRGWSVKRWLLLLLRVLMVLVLVMALASPRVATGLFANAAVGGLLAVLASLASAAALVLWGKRRGILAISIPLVLAVGLWGAASYFGWAVLKRSDESPLSNADGPVAAALIIDTSPTMGYKYHNHTRLEDAKEMARWLMDRFPMGSQVAIIGNDGAIRMNQDRLSAERQLDRVTTEGRASDLSERIQSAIAVVRKSELERREVYVLSDMRERAWKSIGTANLASAISGEPQGTQTPPGEPSKWELGATERQPKVLLQIIDLGVPEVDLRNWGLDALKLSSESVVPGGGVSLDVTLGALEGEVKEQVMVELLAEPVERRPVISRDGQWVAPEAKLLDRQVVQPGSTGGTNLRLQWKDLVEGTNHATVRLSRPDPLESDNVMFVTVEAKEQGRSLVVSDNSVDGQIVALMLNPLAEPSQTESSQAGGQQAGSKSGPEERGSGSRTTGVDVEPRNRIGQLELSKYSTVVLYNPAELSGDEADKLLSWVEAGGGLLVVLGPEAKFEQASKQGTPAVAGSAVGGLPSLLPGRVMGLQRVDPQDPAIGGANVVLKPSLENHPLWNIFERPAKEIPWVSYPVNQYWILDGLPESTSVIADLSQTEHPLLTESVRGSGRIMVMTLPYPEPGVNAQKGAWSELYTTSADAWPGFALFLGTVQYLATQSKHPVNYPVGATAVLENNPKEYPKAYELLAPNGEMIRVEADEEALQYPYTQQPGQYRLRGVRARGPLVRGFSVNIDRDELSLKSVNRLELEAGIGREQLLIAKSKDEVQSSIGEGRYGRDLSPFLWVILAMMVMAEQTMSSRFYGSRGKGKA